LNALLFLLLLSLLVWYWQLNLRAREQAIRQCRILCQEVGYQLLDQTVALVSIRPMVTETQRIRLSRRYRFETSPDGLNRYRGQLHMIGLRLVLAELDTPDGVLIIDKHQDKT